MVGLLKRIRRAAGPARDDDVLLLRLSEGADANPQSPAEALRAVVAEHRCGAQADIVDVHQCAGQWGFPQKIETLIDKCRWRGRGKEPKLRELADTSLQKLSRRMLQQANQVTTPESLHQLRILGKRLRYAMELFAGAYADDFRNLLYPQVEELQDLLGKVNDHAVARQRFRDWLQAAAPDRAGAIQSLLADEEQALGESRAAFYRTFTREHAERMRTSFASLWPVD